jgi:hypothetical protein
MLEHGRSVSGMIRTSGIDGCRIKGLEIVNKAVRGRGSHRQRNIVVSIAGLKISQGES